MIERKKFLPVDGDPNDVELVMVALKHLTRFWAVLNEPPPESAKKKPPD